VVFIALSFLLARVRLQDMISFDIVFTCFSFLVKEVWVLFLDEFFETARGSRSLHDHFKTPGIRT